MSTKLEQPEKWIRLSCKECDRDDYDGISESHLELILPLWGDVHQVQSWADATTVWTEEQCQQHDRSNVDWYTHLGVCPDCRRDDVEEIESAAKAGALFLF